MILSILLYNSVAYDSIIWQASAEQSGLSSCLLLSHTDSAGAGRRGSLVWSHTSGGVTLAAVPQRQGFFSCAHSRAMSSPGSQPGQTLCVLLFGLPPPAKGGRSCSEGTRPRSRAVRWEDAAHLRVNAEAVAKKG